MYIQWGKPVKKFKDIKFPFSLESSVELAEILKSLIESFPSDDFDAELLGDDLFDDHPALFTGMILFIYLVLVVTY